MNIKSYQFIGYIIGLLCFTNHLLETIKKVEPYLNSYFVDADEIRNDLVSITKTYSRILMLCCVVLCWVFCTILSKKIGIESYYCGTGLAKWAMLWFRLNNEQPSNVESKFSYSAFLFRSKQRKSFFQIKFAYFFSEKQSLIHTQEVIKEAKQNGIHRWKTNVLFRNMVY